MDTYVGFGSKGGTKMYICFKTENGMDTYVGAGFVESVDIYFKQRYLENLP